MIEVDCPNCAHKIGEYTGGIGRKIPIESKYYKRIDGTSPAHGSSTAWPCPHCKQQINELIAVMNAATTALLADPEPLE